MARRKKPPGVVYFSQETEDAIIQYNACADEAERNRIFEDKIYHPFLKISECIMNTFKIDNFDMSAKDVQLDTVSHLSKQLHKFNNTKMSNKTLGKKTSAFGYFSTIAKYYLIQRSNTNYKGWKNIISVPLNNMTNKMDNAITDSLQLSHDLKDDNDNINLTNTLLSKFKLIYKWSRRNFKSDSSQIRLMERVKLLLEGNGKWLERRDGINYRFKNYPNYWESATDGITSPQCGIRLLRRIIVLWRRSLKEVDIQCLQIKKPRNERNLESFTRNCPTCLRILYSYGHNSCERAREHLIANLPCPRCRGKTRYVIGADGNYNFTKAKNKNS